MPSRHFLAAGVLTFVCLAAAPPAGAAEPVEAATCSAVVDGAPGQEVVLDPRSVADPVAGALAGLDPLGVLTGPFRNAWNSAGPIPLGTVSAGQTEIPGASVADAVAARVKEIPLLGPVLGPLTSAVRQVLNSLCGILVRGTGPDSPPASAPASPAQPANPESPSASAGFKQASEVGSTGGAVFGERLPWLFLSGAALSLHTDAVPQPGAVVATERPALAGSPQSAGSALTLPAAQDGLSQPVLLAVLALTVVSAQLVRRLALRTRR